MYATMALQKSVYHINQINSMMNDFRQSKVWGNSRLLMIQIYRLTENFPDDDDQEFKNQIRDSSVLITGNIVRALQAKAVDKRSRFLKDAELCMNKLTTNLQAAYQKGYIQGSMNKSLFKEIFEIQKSLKAIQY